MSDPKTNVTELATALGMLGISRDKVERRRLPPIVGVDDSAWASAVVASEGGAHSDLFELAHNNGTYFLGADDGLRGRPPRVVQWKGPHKAVGDEATPADLRIDHVYLVSCKYLSKVLHNSSPGALFQRLLTGGQGHRTSSDWFLEAAPREYQAYYEEAVKVLGEKNFPLGVQDLKKDQRTLLKQITGVRSVDLDAAAQQFHLRVAEESALRWREAMSRELSDERRMLWRLLRIGSAPYFVLGAAPEGPLRLRVATPWDWSQRYDLKSLVISPKPGGQPMVTWEAVFDDRMTSTRSSVHGHVEIRWSHGKFCGPPEAKIYLDSPLSDVPGYFYL